MRNSVHILILCLVSLFVAGCDESVSDVVAPEKEIWVNLNIGVALSDAAKPARSSRVDSYEPAANEAEKMQTLRIVVVDKHGDVEANRFLYAGSVVEYGEEHFKVRANETKQVYVFVNENNESVKVYDATGGLVADLHDYLGGIEVGEPFPRESIEGLEIRLNDGVDSELDAVGDASAQSAGGLPMSKCESIEVYDKDLSHDIYLHRAAVKFTFNITNNSSLDRVLTGLSIDKMAYREYYLPRVDEYKYVDGKPMEIVDFDTPSPEGTNNGYYTFEKSFEQGVSLPKGKEVTAPLVYLLEGKYESAAVADAAKNYSMTISLNGAKTQAKVFDNLDRLPRNTHVVVNITIKDRTIEWGVDLRPYGEVKLDPDFGLDRD